MNCPICRTREVAFVVKDAPAFYKDPKEPVLRLDCPKCSNYWLNAVRHADGQVAVDPPTLATIEPLTDTERAYFSECVQRMIDHNCWLIIGPDNADHFLGDWRWAQTMAQRWGFEGARLMISGGGFDAANRLFFVVHQDGTRHVLRLVSRHAEPARTRTMMDWLERLRQAEVPTLTPVAGLDGAMIQTASMDGTSRQGVVFEWIAGPVWEDLPKEAVTVDLARNFGAAVGRAHQVSATMETPNWYHCRRYDGRCFTQYMERLKAKPHRDYSAAQIAEFEGLERRLLVAMETLGEGRDDFGIVPADLAPHNTQVVGTVPYLVDMMSFGWGYFLADLQKAMRLTFDREEHETAFLAGYQQVRPLPRGFDQFRELFAEAKRVAVHWF